jgi:hypothetical protein
MFGCACPRAAAMAGRMCVITGRASIAGAGRWPASSRLAWLSRCAASAGLATTGARAIASFGKVIAARRTGCARVNTLRGTAVAAPLT